MGNQLVEIYTDGACRGNPGPGGWGVLMRCGKIEKYLYGSENYTTNNRMELVAAIQALSALKKTCKIKLTTDSEYVRRGVTEWMINWKKNAWRTSAKKPVKNVDLWQELDLLMNQFEISWHWVKGHSGHRENEIADQLANRAIDELLLK